MEVFKQPQYSPIPVEVQAAVLWSAQNGFFDDVAVERIKDCQAKLTDYLTTRKSALMAKVAKEKTLSESLTVPLKASLGSRMTSASSAVFCATAAIPPSAAT